MSHIHVSYEYCVVYSCSHFDHCSHCTPGAPEKYTIRIVGLHFNMYTGGGSSVHVASSRQIPPEPRPSTSSSVESATWSHSVSAGMCLRIAEAGFRYARGRQVIIMTNVSQVGQSPEAPAEKSSGRPVVTGGCSPLKRIVVLKFSGLLKISTAEEPPVSFRSLLAAEGGEWSPLVSFPYH